MNQNRNLKERLQESRAIFNKTGHCYGLERLPLKEQDPIKYEIFHSRLYSSTVAARELAKRVSCSAMTREMSELAVGVFTPEGDAATSVTFLMVHFGKVSDILRWFIENDFEVNPGIKEGDILCTNDPRSGGMHSPDVNFVTPVFWEGELIAWIGAANHVWDCGDTSSSGALSAVAFDMSMEGVYIVGEKVGENDRFYRSYEDRIKRGSRLPAQWLMDDRGRLTAMIHVREDIKSIIKEFGIDYYKEASRELVEDCRRHHLARVRERLLPGRYRSIGMGSALMKEAPVFPYAQKDHVIPVPMQIDIDCRGKMVFDFEGVPPEGFHNMQARPEALNGAIYCAMVQLVDCADPMVNSGLMYEIERRDTAPGTILNPVYKFAATGRGWGLLTVHGSGMMSIFSRALWMRGYWEEVNPGGAVPGIYALTGVDAQGNLFGGMNPEIINGQSGALGFRDGFVGFSLMQPLADQGSAEIWEMYWPHIYLGRGLVPDAMSNGRLRGGANWGSMFMVWNSPYCYFSGGPGPGAVMQNLSLFGGYTSFPCLRNWSIDTNMKELIDKRLPLPHGLGSLSDPDIGRLVKGDVVFGHVENITPSMKDYDLFEALYSPSGGSIGDVLERDPALVEADLNAGICSREGAEAWYGVKASFDEATEEWKVDLEATKACREARRRKRLAKGRPVNEWWKEERQKFLAGEMVKEIKEMYQGCRRISPTFDQEFRGFWALTDDRASK